MNEINKNAFADFSKNKANISGGMLVFDRATGELKVNIAIDYHRHYEQLIPRTAFLAALRKLAKKGKTEVIGLKEAENTSGGRRLEIAKPKADETDFTLAENMLSGEFGKLGMKKLDFGDKIAYAKGMK